MKKIRAAVVGYGNIGHYSVQALEAAPDFEIAGVVRRQGAHDKPLELTPYEVVDDITKLKNVDVAILATPTRSCPETGSDSIVRVLMESLAPKGLTYTNFGPGMSMGHSVCVRGKQGVRNALSVTIPLGEGIHRRMVYVELEDGARLEDVTAEIKADPYFAHDETHVFAVASVDDVRDMGHGVNLVRKGVSGRTPNQRMEFNMSINNPALTAQVLVNVARATFRLQPGCYTMPEIPVIDMLPGTCEEIVATLV